MGEAAAKKKPAVDPWARSKANDRFSGPNSMHAKVYEADRAKTPVKQRPTSPKGPAHPLGTPAKRAVSAPKPRSKTPDAVARAKTPDPVAPKTPEISNVNAGDSARTPGKSPAFAAGKGRFESGVGSYVAKSVAPGPGQFNPDDLGGMGSKSNANAKIKASPGMAPTSKGRFDSGAGSIYASAAPAKKVAKKKAPEPEDAAAEEWSKRLGLGAVAGAKAAPVLKAVDEARAHAEAVAAEAVAAKEAAEAAAAEAIRKAEWMTQTATRKVAEAAERAEAAEAEMTALRAAHHSTSAELEETRETLAAVEAEAGELRKELEKLAPKRGKSPGRDAKVIDRRPVRLRGLVDADKEDSLQKVEERKKKREEHWKKVEQERIEKEDKIRQEQLAKSAAALGSARRSQRSDRRGSGPPPPPDALKAFALEGMGIPVAASKSTTARSTARAAEETAAEAEGASARDASPKGKSPFHSSPAKGRKPSPARKLRPTAVEEQQPEQHEQHEEAPLDVSDSSGAAASSEQPAARADSGRPTGMASSSPSPASSPMVGDEMMGDDEGMSAAQLAYDDDDDAFASAEAEAEQLAVEEARKAADARDDARAHARALGGSAAPSLDAKLGSLRDSAGSWVSAKAAGMGYDDLGDDIGEEASEAAAAAVKAVMGGGETLFSRDTHLAGSSGNLSSSLTLSGMSSFNGMKLSSSMEAMPHDDFLSRLQKAEAMPTSPGGMKGRMAGMSGFSSNPSPALFNRGVVS